MMLYWSTGNKLNKRQAILSNVELLPTTHLLRLFESFVLFSNGAAFLELPCFFLMLLLYFPPKLTHILIHTQTSQGPTTASAGG